MKSTLNRGFGRHTEEKPADKEALDHRSIKNSGGTKDSRDETLIPRRSYSGWTTDQRG